MAYHPKQKLSGRERRKVRVRKNVLGTTAKPRLSVFRSGKHIYAQVIDDSAGATLAAASTLAGSLKTSVSGKAKKDQAQEVGKAIAEACKAKSIENVVFDRNGYLYHGRVKAVADGAREGGLQF